ncbi:diadenosine tetraphosphate hydrolase [Bacillus sp. FJAT-27225]|uniref:HIT family protein n=1 Tax=Bacillus sp. FJAT-27225 TaxID=1743144 RepID=UPI00080C3236|nr:diadenosine tetraphosphate hydrolase [Bacillus sp. FJAT-27225]OCA87561.1 diadenosine tetraphosphate hydrolase [Bacillus sp. FJAT-27225]
MRRMTLATGETVEVACLSCAITGGIIKPEGGTLIESQYFHAHQDVAYPIKGLVILASKRHFTALDEIGDAEADDLIRMLRKIRTAQREALGIDYVYYFYNEDTTHHFHVWMVPRYPWMNAFGRSIESVRPVLLHARHKLNTEQNRKDVHDSLDLIRSHLNTK